MPEIVAVIGPQRSGTSCVAGVLSKLGIPMGVSWQENGGNPRGYYEDRGLRRIHVQSFYEIWDDRRKNSYARRVQMLRAWARRRSGEGPIIGGKIPHMCLMVPEMNEAWPRWKAIATIRPAADSAHSMRRLRGLPVEDKERGIQKAIDQRDADLKRLGVTALWLPYTEVITARERSVYRIVEFLGISPSVRQFCDAVRHIDPSLNHFSHPEKVGA